MSKIPNIKAQVMNRLEGTKGIADPKEYIKEYNTLYTALCEDFDEKMNTSDPNSQYARMMAYMTFMQKLSENTGE